MSDQDSSEQLQAAVQTARTAVLAGRARLADLQSTRTGQEEQLVELEATPGESLLDDPDAAAELPKQLREVRDAVAVSERLCVAQEDRVVAAERDYLAAEADLFEHTVHAPAAAALDAHQVRTQELLAALEDHDGPYVPAEEVLTARHQPEIDPPLQLPARRVQALLRARNVAERQLAGLRSLAAGEDPDEASTGRVLTDGEYAQASRPIEERLPACVLGPGALVPAPEFVRRVERVRRQVADLEAADRRLRVERAEGERRQLEEEDPRVDYEGGLLAIEERREHVAQQRVAMGDQLVELGDADQARAARVNARFAREQLAGVES